MKSSESINELAAALAKAQGTMKGALKDSDNPFFKSKYADLTSVVEAIRESFSQNGLSYIQTVEPSEKNEARVGTTILHSSGQWIDCGSVAVPVSKADAQGFGSAITYARRYSLSAATGVAPEDDDGNAASKAAPKNARREAEPTNSEYPWSDDDYTNAKNLIADLADILLDRGVDEAEIKTIVGKPESTIGDTSIGFDKWANRLHAYSQRTMAKYPARPA